MKMDVKHELEYLINPVIVICQGDDTCLIHVSYRCRTCGKFYCLEHAEEHGKVVGVEGLPDIKEVKLAGEE